MSQLLKLSDIATDGGTQSREAINDAHEIRDRFQHQLAGVVDAGPCASKPTTVIYLVPMGVSGEPVVMARVFEPKLCPKLVDAKAIELIRSPDETGAVEFITFPNCIRPMTWFHMSNAGAAAAFHDVLPSMRVRPAFPRESCMTTVLPLGHFGPSRT